MNPFTKNIPKTNRFNLFYMVRGVGFEPTEAYARGFLELPLKSSPLS